MSQHLLVIVSLISCVQCCAPGGGGGRPISNVTDSELVERARSLAQAGVCAQVSRGGPPRSRVVRRQAGGQCGVVSGECDKNLESVYHEEVISVDGEERRLVVTNGIPSHNYHDYTGTNR